MSLNISKYLFLSLKLLIFQICYFYLLLSNTSFGENYFFDTTYTSYSDQNSVTEKQIESYKLGLSTTPFNSNRTIPVEDSNADFEYINNSIEYSVQESMIESIDKIDSISNQSYTYEKFVENQTSVPTTESNKDSFFPAYNQQHTSRKGVRFEQVISSFNEDRSLSESSSNEFKTFTDIERLETSQDSSFDNVVTKINGLGISKKLLVDKINSVYFEPNLSTPFNNVIPVEKNNVKRTNLNEVESTQKTEIFGSI